MSKKKIDVVTPLSMDWDDVTKGSDSIATLAGADGLLNISDALIMSISERGHVDLDYIARLSGKSLEQIIEALKGAIYQNPETWDGQLDKGWEIAEEYLSGNLYRKLTAAKEADEKYHCFSRNIQALSELLPDFLKVEDIYVTIGSPWVPTWVIDDFIEYLFGGSSRYHFSKYPSYKVKHNEYGWEVPEKNRYCHNVHVSHKYGTHRLEALHILEMTLNMRTAAVYDEMESDQNRSGIKLVLNEEETYMAIEKQKLLIQEFQDWVWKDQKRHNELLMIFESKYACNRQRLFDGSYLTFPGMSPEEQLYPYQKDAVSRILLTGNTLLAHECGCGKTFVMICAGMELRRLHLSQKNMYVVPNNIVTQWKDMFLRLYPNAKVLVLEPKVFSKTKRAAMLRKVRDEDYDAVIVAYSCFDMIPVSKAYYMNELEEQKTQLEELAKDRRKATAAVRAKLKSVTTALGKLAASPKGSSDEVFFDELKVQRLFVDEAHNFKNVPVDTRIYGIPGISKTGSKKCQHMMDIVRIVQRENQGGGVVMATGTPITNSLTDIYVMQQYLASGELAMLDLQAFDSWVGMFAEKNTELEIDVDTSRYKMATRFSKFHNLPELTALISSFTDFHLVDEHAGLPEVDGYDDICLPRSPELSTYLKTISERTEAIHRGNVKRTEDNLLKVTTDGRKAALDIRLVMPEAGSHGQLKVSKCALNVTKVYLESMSIRGTQLVFCDLSTPREGFNLYDELKNLLVSMGIPSSEIAFIHDADTEMKRKSLYQKVCKGIVRVLIGSTFKMGLGVNIQERMVALHHLSIPWRPADCEQREARLIRSGNINKKVRIFRYCTENSLDAWSWQLLEIKQQIITDLLSGTMGWRYADDVDGTVLSYAEIKALAIGNPIIKRRCEAVNELRRFLALQRKLVKSKKALEERLATSSEVFSESFLDAADNLKDLELYRSWLATHPSTHTRKEVTMETARRRKLAKALKRALKDNVMRSRERLLGVKYKGFDIVLPADMTEEESYIWLEGTVRHKVNVSLEDPDILSHLDSVLGSLSRHVEKQQQDIREREAELERLENELAKEESYDRQIRELRKEIEQIDKELEVDKQ